MRDWWLLRPHIARAFRRSQARAGRPRPVGRGRQAGRRSAMAMALAGTLLAVTPVDARSPEAFGKKLASDVAPISSLGSYIAGKIARSQNDIESAAGLFRRALASDPDNPRLIEQSFLMEASEGRVPQATRLARQLVESRKDHRLAQLWLGIMTFRDGDFVRAAKHLKTSEAGPIAELTSVLARAWVHYAAGRESAAIRLLNSDSIADWAKLYRHYHRGLIADLANRPRMAERSFRSVLRIDGRQPRSAMAFARSAAARGQRQRAIAVLEQHIKETGGNGHPSSRALLKRIVNGGPVDRLVSNANDGLAEVLYGLGEALSDEGGATPIGIIYLQLALALKPDFPFALTSLANVYETVKAYERANETYDLVRPGTPLQGAIEIRKALNLNALDKVDAARKILVAKIEANPNDLVAIEAVANMLRSRKRYAEAIPYYTKAIDMVGEPKPRHWVYWYSRGTCYERTKQWPKAEADLQKARELSPNQPLVLNYLGYSWVDQGQRLKEGLKLIKQAVALKPDDGYITDSLGWAYYRLGNLPMAVKYLERAVELRPEDPILNDHLGDALWKIGRQREARYQWKISLSFDPEPDDVIKIRSKLAQGLSEPLTRKAETTGDTSIGNSVR